MDRPDERIDRLFALSSTDTAGIRRWDANGRAVAPSHLRALGVEPPVGQQAAHGAQQAAFLASYGQAPQDRPTAALRTGVHLMDDGSKMDSSALEW